MNNQTFELELVQLEELFAKSRSNRYSDSRKNLFFKELYEVFNCIIKCNYSSFDIHSKIEHRAIFNFLFNGLEFLDSSTLNIIPYEIVYCLGEALKDWVPADDLVIVTSLSQRRGDIWFEGWEEEEVRNIKELIYSKYSIYISKRLIRISLPKSLSRDYLAGVVLYHELGHFVDSELNITNKIFYEKYGKTYSEITTLEEYRFYHYQKEFFADLFASQYINDSSSSYLNHLAYNHGDSDSHPATKTRDEIVKKFLLGESCEEIDNIQNALIKSGNLLLEIRHEIIEPKESDFINLIPQRISPIKQLHGIFKLAWDLWNGTESNFLKSFSRRQRYYIINNLTEKSISNYNVVKNWIEVKKEIKND